MSSTDDSLHRAEELLARLEAARGELDQLASGESSSPDRALEILDSEVFRSGDYSTSFLDEVQLAALA